MTSEKQADQIVWYFVQFGFIEKDIPAPDLVALARSGTLSIFSGDVLLQRGPLFGLVKDGAVSMIFEAKYRRPDRATLDFHDDVELSQEVTSYWCVFEVTR
jgi:hypothetical protein